MRRKISGGNTLTNLSLSLAMGNYDRTRAIVDGTVKIDGVDPVPMLLSGIRRSTSPSCHCHPIQYR